MSKNNKTISCGKITSQQLFDFRKIKYNGYICRGGIHGDTSYNRLDEKDKFNKLLDEELYEEDL